MKTILLIGAMVGMSCLASQAKAGVHVSVGLGGFFGGPYYAAPPYAYGYGGPTAYYYGPGYGPSYTNCYRGGYYRGGRRSYASPYSHH
jgi:hypothetical protein